MTDILKVTDIQIDGQSKSTILFQHKLQHNILPQFDDEHHNSGRRNIPRKKFASWLWEMLDPLTMADESFLPVLRDTFVSICYF